MSQRPVKLKANELITVCPSCGDNTQFVLHSEQVAEDFCETWVSCACGFDHGDRREDVWGGLSREMAEACLYDWNDIVSPIHTGINYEAHV